MESGQRIEVAGEAKTRPGSTISEDVLSIPSKKLGSSSSSSASDSSPDGTFELNTNEASEFLKGTDYLLENDKMYAVEDRKPAECKLISDEMETHHKADISNVAMISNHSPSQPLLTTPESSLPGHSPYSASPSVTWPMDAIVEPQKPGEENHAKFIELDDKTFPDFQAAHTNTSTCDLGMQPGPQLGEDLLTSSSSSSSSSSDSEPEPEPRVSYQPDANATNNLFTDKPAPPDNPFTDKPNPPDNPFTGKDGLPNNPFTEKPGPPNLEKDNRLVLDSSDDDIPISSMPSNGQSPVASTPRSELRSDSQSTTQYPPIQVMERHEDSPSSTYRIPSHVFSRTKSTAPMEWSVASNESLFSIHMGNMSFTREQLCWLGKSGELCRPGELPMSPLIDIASSQPLLMKPSDNGLNGSHSDVDPVVTEATAAETMRQVIRENSENQRKENSTLTEFQSVSLSRQSGSSTKSFQFPILTGDGGKSMSMKADDEKPKQQTQPESPRPPSNPQTPKDPNAVQSPRTTPNVGPRKWLSCFSCCPFCS